MAVAAIEASGYAQLLLRLGMDAATLPPQKNPTGWPLIRSLFAAAFLTKTRDEWCGEFAGSEACLAPVLDLREAPLHPHNVARDAFVTFGGLLQPGPAPRFSVTPASLHRTPPVQGQNSRSILAEWGVSEARPENYSHAAPYASPIRSDLVRCLLFILSNLPGS